MVCQGELVDHPIRQHNRCRPRWQTQRFNEKNHLRMYDQKVLEPNSQMCPIGFAQHHVLFENIWDNDEFNELMKNDSVKNKDSHH